MGSIREQRPVIGGALHPVVQRLVRDALRLGVGGTLPTNITYQRDFGMGAGTIQRALSLLDEQGAVRTTSRGQLGRVINDLDVGRAWRTGALQPIRIVLPPGGAAEIDAAQEVLAEGLTSLGIAHTVHHRAGGAGRLASVASGVHDLAMVSNGTLALAGTSTGPVRVLPAGSYYAADRLVTVRRAATTGQPLAGQRIGIDTTSSDHTALTEAEFPGEVTLVPIAFPRIPAAVLRGDIDAGIWHITRSVIPLGLCGLAIRPLTRPTASHLARRLSPAALVGWSGRLELAAVLAQLSFADLPRRQVLQFNAELDENI